MGVQRASTDERTVFVNEVDVAQAELDSLVEIEVAEQRALHAYTNVPFVRGSTLQAST